MNAAITISARKNSLLQKKKKKKKEAIHALNWFHSILFIRQSLFFDPWSIGSGLFPILYSGMGRYGYYTTEFLRA